MSALKDEKGTCEIICQFFAAKKSLNEIMQYRHA